MSLDSVFETGLVLEGQRQIEAAVERGDVEALELLFNSPTTSGMFERPIGQCGSSILHFACRQFLLKKRGHIADESADMNKRRLLVVEFLLDRVPSLTNMASSNGRTPLFSAISSLNVPLCELLLAKGALVNQTDVCRRTPLHFVCTLADKDGEQGKYAVAMVDLLLRYGASVQAQDNENMTPLHVASMFENQFVLARLLAEVPPLYYPVLRSCDTLSNTPLHIAAAYGRGSCTKLLIARDPRAVDIDNIYNKKPLNLAIETNSPEAVIVLISARALEGGKEDWIFQLLESVSRKSKIKSRLYDILLAGGLDIHPSVHLILTRIMASGGSDLALELTTRARVPSLQSLCRNQVRKGLAWGSVVQGLRDMDLSPHLQLFLTYGVPFVEALKEIDRIFNDS